MKLFNTRPMINIENVDNIHVEHGYMPFHEESLLKILDEFLELKKQYEIEGINIYSNQNRRQEKSRFSNTIDLISKIISIIATLGIVIFIVLLLFGKSTIGQISITNLLTIFSFTLFGGLISIGGVKLFTLSANFNKTKQELSNLINYQGGYPFVYAINNEAKRQYNIKSPFLIGDRRFCNHCMLIDHNGRTDCKISPMKN